MPIKDSNILKKETQVLQLMLTSQLEWLIRKKIYVKQRKIIRKVEVD